MTRILMTKKIEEKKKKMRNEEYSMTTREEDKHRNVSLQQSEAPLAV